MMAIAQRLSHAGHDVTFLTAEYFREKAQAGGLRFVPVTGKANYDYRQVGYLPAKGSQPDDSPNVNRAARMFVETVPDQFRCIEEIMRETPVDLILVGSMYFGVFPLLLGAREKRPPVIGCGGIPIMFSSPDCSATNPPDNTPEGRRKIQEENRAMQAMIQPFDDRMNRTLGDVMNRAVGDSLKTTPDAEGPGLLPYSTLESMYRLPDRFLQFTSESFEFPRSDMPERLSFAGPLLPPPSAHFEEPAWWSELDGSRPVVLVTQGTFANHDFNEVIQPTLDGLAEEDVLVIAAAGRSDTETIAAPANARVAAFVPFDRLLPKVDVFVTNGGYGAVSHALSLGVPVVTAGEMEDKAWVGARVNWTGVGLHLRARYASAEWIRDAVRMILEDGKYRDAARRMQADFARYNALNKVAEIVEETLAEEKQATAMS